MKDNRNKWKFYTHPSKTTLTASEVRYWKESMKKLLKVGIEFEFNLKELKAKCRGDNIQCPCIHIDKDCWKICQRHENCKRSPYYDTCTNKAKKCKPEKCKNCSDYNLRCLGTSCVEFISKCFTCENFEKNCNTCPKKYDPKQDPKSIRKVLYDELRPSQRYEKVSSSGVIDIVTDGSLLGDKGVEIITIGRRIDFWEFYTMSKKILDRATDLGAYLNERCGLHMHLLASYYESEHGINEMERNMPEIILANFHQLCRRYQNAMTWMTMALDDPNHMTRWEKYRVSILGITPVTADMKTVAEEVASNAGGNKYGWVNYSRMRFEGDKISRFHVEMRVPDETLCPSIYAALACMFYALVIKAIEISRYGLLKVGEEEWLKKAREMKKAILNNCSDWGGENRFSNTEKVLDYRENYITESLDLIDQLKGILLKLGPAHDILIKLAERPVALRRIDGEKWEDIEEDLRVEINEIDQMELKLNEIIDLRIIEDCKTMKEWITEVSKVVKEDKDTDQKVTTEDIELFVNGRMREGEIIWSDSVGSIIAI